MATGNIPRDVYEKYCKGDSITDAELEGARLYWANVAGMLSGLGPVFSLAHREARRVADALESFYQARRAKG